MPERVASRSRARPRQGPSPARLYATLAGAGLVLAGLAGFLYETSFATGRKLESDAVLGVLEVNGWHNLLHLATGALGLALATRAARTYALAVGLAYLLLSLWGFLAADGGFATLLDIIPVNTGGNVLHLLLGLAGLAAGAATPAQDTGSRPRATKPAPGER